MPTDNIDRQNLTITGAHSSLPERSEGLSVEGDILIVVTKAFGPGGDDMMAASKVSFDGYPGIPVLVQADGREELVHLSPFHGDSRKAGMEGLAPGTKCTLLCPVTRRPLDRVGPVGPGSSAEYHAIYLTPRLSRGEVALISDVWDDYHSRVIDNFELISSWEVGDEPGA